MNKLFKRNQILYEIFIFFFLLFFVLLYINFLQNKLPNGDGQSILLPVKNYILTNSLNFRSDFNEKYSTYYFKFTPGDTIIKNRNEIYPIQQGPIILYYVHFSSILGIESFFYFNFILYIFGIIFFYFLMKILYNSKFKIITGLILFSTFPLMVLYGIFPHAIMLQVFFIIISIYFLLKYDTNNSKRFFLLSIFFLFLGSIFRLTSLFFILIHIFYLIKNKTHIRSNIITGIPIFFLVFIPFLLINKKYFGEFFFIGYLWINNYPIPSGYSLDYVTEPVVYLSVFKNLFSIINGAVYYIKGSLNIFFPLFFISIVGLFKSKNNILKYGILITFLISLFYNSSIAESLWSSGESNYPLVLGFFRYMLAISIFLILFIPNIYNTFRIGPKLKLFILFSILVVSPFLPINYKGGASLTYFNKIQKERYVYSKAVEGLIPSNSVILIHERNSQYYLYPNIFNYRRFCYSCVPVPIQQEHTKSIVASLLKDNQKVYIAYFLPPYIDPLSEKTQQYLEKEFNFIAVKGTEFEREKFKFYKISLK